MQGQEDSQSRLVVPCTVGSFEQKGYQGNVCHLNSGHSTGVSQAKDTGVSQAQGSGQGMVYDQQGLLDVEAGCVAEGLSNQLVVTMVRQLKRPAPEVKRFGGEPMEYRKFLRQFKTRIVCNTEDDDERMNYLEQYTVGEANKIVTGYCHLDAKQGYQSALKELEERYGNVEVIANAYLKRALDWPVIKADKPKALDEFAIFLTECENAVRSMSAMQVFEYSEVMAKLVQKLPFYLHDKWRSVVQQKRDKQETVRFGHLVALVKIEAKKANDPAYGKEVLGNDRRVSHGKGQSSKSTVSRPKASFATEVTPTTNQGAIQRQTALTKPSKDKPVKDRTETTSLCTYCNSPSHTLEVCKKLTALPFAEKVDFLKSRGLCFGCLKPGHQSKHCFNKATCGTCKRRHPTVLHDDSRANLSSTRADSKSGNSMEACSKSVCARTGVGKTSCTMAIVPVQVKLRNGACAVQTYAFLDPGSSVTFCTDHLIEQLGATGHKMSITLDTMGNSFSMQTLAVNGLQVCDMNLENEIDLPKVYTKDKIPVSQDHIPTNQDLAQWAHLQSLQLPEIDAEVGLLIGNNVADAYTPLDLITGPQGSPHAARTMLGWVVWNLVRKSSSNENPCYPVNRIEVVAVEEIEQLNKMVKESIDMDFPERLSNDQKEHSQQDKKFLDLVNQSITQEDGHYCIQLPFKNSEVKLPDNRSQALKRLTGLKRKMTKNVEFRKDYSDFMTTIMDKGYAERVPTSELDRSDGRVWFIPHHGVYHPRKPNKIRVVFDCSASYAGVSLNSLLLQGPDMTNSLLGVLLRFRQENIAVMGDIESMFYQVQVPKVDRDCLRFYWWPNGDLNQDPVVYRMCVHLFGAVSSPSCASFALRQTAADNMGSESQSVVDLVKRNFYVDDCLGSAGTVGEATDLIEGSTSLVAKGGFHLTKWISNDHEVMESVKPEERAKGVKDLNLECQELPNERALGVYWFVESDSLGFKIQLKPNSNTRRGMLSIVCSVYDPLGIASPFVLVAKQLLQDLCRRNVAWDEEITDSDLSKWQQWLTELPELERMSIRRCYKPPDFGTVVSCQLHNFADASDRGYGMVSYLRFVNETGDIVCSFLHGKARVAPLKKITTPRMELTAATAAVRLSNMLVKQLDYHIDGIYFWTDSMSVLRYLANETCRFHTFVANRVEVIRDASTVQQWKYVESKANPADCASRGLGVQKFLQSTLWLHGPDFLSLPQAEWPAQPGDLSLVAEDQIEVHTAIEQVLTATDKLLEYFSDWNRLKRAVGWILVLIEHKMTVQPKGRKPVSVLSLDFLQQAERAILLYVQRKHFKEDIQVLEQSASTSSCKVKRLSAISKLEPIVVDGLIRVGGRLERADIPFNMKHPILVPKSSPIAKLIVEDAHRSVGHLGRNAVLARLRQKYWITGAATVIRSVLYRCVTCRKYQAPTLKQKMANLPIDRVTPNEKPFSRVGMDYFGPFEVRRGRSTVKRYGVIFTCLAIRAVHIEMASSLDTDSCINAIRRFIARRGTVKYIRSDNGTNLVGAEREMREEIQKWNAQRISDMLLQKSITWEFNPPTGSHFGGVWERLIRTIRKVLYSLLREQNVRLDDESLSTLFCEAEAIINGRPLTEAPNLPSDLEVLTPNHLLLLESVESSSPGVFSSTDCYAKRWRQIQYLADMFWKRWIREYLPLLQERQKWLYPQRNLAIGDIVLIVDNSPRNSWALGRVLEVIRDKKDHVRMVKLKTKAGTLLRPIVKLCLVLEGDQRTS